MITKISLALIVIVGLLEGYLLWSGNRVLIAETLIRTGQTYDSDKLGTISSSGQATLICKFFTGRGTVERAYWYSPNGMFGRDSCPFITGP